jgi:antitoxin (DNA-binding transcriptional repressor) of toxin-antitoxin stability system
MKTYNIYNTKKQLSKLVELSAKGESFVISKAGKPMVKVTALNVPESLEKKRFGFMAGQIKVPNDFNSMGAATLETLFKGET